MNWDWNGIGRVGAGLGSGSRKVGATEQGTGQERTNNQMDSR